MGYSASSARLRHLGPPKSNIPQRLTEFFTMSVVKRRKKLKVFFLTLVLFKIYFSFDFDLIFRGTQCLQPDVSGFHTEGKMKQLHEPLGITMAVEEPAIL